MRRDDIPRPAQIVSVADGFEIVTIVAAISRNAVEVHKIHAAPRPKGGAREDFNQIAPASAPRVLTTPFQ